MSSQEMIDVLFLSVNRLGELALSSSFLAVNSLIVHCAFRAVAKTIEHEGDIFTTVAAITSN
jgi:hypothetical protein